MADEHRITQANPIHHLGRMDYARCAALHNELLFRGWTGVGNEWIKPPTWWEYESPSDAIASRLHPSLVEFLKLAYHVPCDTLKPGNKWQSLFFFINCLSGPEEILSLLERDTNGRDRFLLLYVSSGFMNGDEQGILFDQHTLKATYVLHRDDTYQSCSHEWGWLPLEAILDSYLEMSDEGKVSIIRDFSYELDSDDEYDQEPSVEEPWLMNPYSKTDVAKAVAALRRLVTAIESRMENLETTTATTATKAGFQLPWSDPITLNQTFTPPDSFAHEFLTAVSKWTVQFQYLAPGIRFPTVAEFLDQDVRELKYPGNCSLRVFQIDPEDEQQETDRQIPQTHGLYIDTVVPRYPEFFANGCSLRLPFAIGHGRAGRGGAHARMSNGQLIPAYERDSLYQDGYLSSNGLVRGHSVRIHRVLESWAERVEQGDWEVGEDGVVGGIGKFREADMEEHWRKYWIELSW